MKIELKGPYSDRYKFGYLRTCKDKRKRVDLFNSNQDRTTVTYAKYLMSVQLGRLVDKNEEVDHIDGDRTNDSIENLQVIPKQEHRKKTAKEREPRKFIITTCTYCGVEFKKWANQINGKKNLFCSRSCNAKFTKANGGFKGKAGVAPSVF
ncbi:hypothetical protein TY_10 [Pseudomonas phage vB_PaeM_Ty]|nr:hypothetical protein TY_10 [Pseudomonas phage vB_PaeM_Ty]